MNRIELPHRPVKKRRKRIEAPAQLELTLPLPRGHEPARPEATEDEAEAPPQERGIAVVDFYI